MKYNIYLIPNFNNYYNRRLKKLKTLNQYKALPDITEKENINVDIKDGIHATVTLNYSTLFTKSPDYAILEDRDSGKFTRWFVIDVEKNRGLQYNINLKRDIVADYKDELMLADCYIEKGYHNNSDAKYNLEPFQYNKIKVKQTPLYDETNTPWIVGFINKTTPQTTANIDIETKYDYIYDSISNFPYYDYSNRGSKPNGLSKVSSYKLRFTPGIRSTNGAWGEWSTLFYYDLNGTSLTPRAEDRANYSQHYGCYRKQETDVATNLGFYIDLTLPSTVDMVKYSSVNNIKSQVSNFIANKTESDRNTFRNTINNALGLVDQPQLQGIIDDLFNNYNDKIIKDSTSGKYYLVKIQPSSTELDHGVPATTQYGIYGLMPQWFPNDVQPGTGSATVHKTGTYGLRNQGTMVPFVDMTKYELVLTEVANANIIIPAKEDRVNCITAQYDIFTMPLNRLNVLTASNQTIPTTGLGIQIAQGIATALNANCFDIQLVPYCPIRSLWKEDKIDLRTANAKEYTVIRNAGSSGGNIIDFIFWLSNSTASEIDLNYPIVVEDIKKDVNLKQYRICSPNFSSQFEFSAGKNEGVKKFKFSYDYKPYNSYVRVHPDFNGLYGRDYQDVRGMIYSGDMSLTQISDEWVKYQLENKNYQNAFDREIESMEKQQRWSIAESATGAVSGALSGGITGAAGGALAAGSVGALAGGITGSIASVGGGIADIIKNVSLSNDAIDKAKDLFKYQLENIQAMPRTISKMTTITVDNINVPILEEYSCLASEEVDYEARIAKFGMTINRVGQITDFIDENETFVQGYVIRFNETDINEEGADNMLVKVLSDELQKGIYMKLGD